MRRLDKLKIPRPGCREKMLNAEKVLDWEEIKRKIMIPRCRDTELGGVVEEPERGGRNSHY